MIKVQLLRCKSTLDSYTVAKNMFCNDGLSAAVRLPFTWHDADAISGKVWREKGASVTMVPVQGSGNGIGNSSPFQDGVATTFCNGIEFRMLEKNGKP